MNAQRKNRKQIDLTKIDYKIKYKNNKILRKKL